jgi:putative acetyltransferase
VIRPYQPSDCQALLDVWARASAVAHPFLSPDFMARERHNVRDVYLPMAETWVWDAGGHVAGFISLLGNEVGGIFVEPGRHRSGIGRALVERARDGRGDLEVEVFERNAIGRAFYARLGFELLHTKTHAETGLEILRLRLPSTGRLVGRP